MRLIKIGAGAAALTAVIALAATIGVEMPASQGDIRDLEQHLVQSDTFAVEEAIKAQQVRVWTLMDRHDDLTAKGKPITPTSRSLLRNEEARLRTLRKRLQKLQ